MKRMRQQCFYLSQGVQLEMAGDEVKGHIEADRSLAKIAVSSTLKPFLQSLIKLKQDRPNIVDPWPPSWVQNDEL